MKKKFVVVIRFRHCELQISSLAGEGIIFTSGSLGTAEIEGGKKIVHNGERTEGAKPPCDLFPCFSQELQVHFHVNVSFLSFSSRGEFAVIASRCLMCPAFNQKTPIKFCFLYNSSEAATSLFHDTGSPYHHTWLLQTAGKKFSSSSGQENQCPLTWVRFTGGALELFTVMSINYPDTHTVFTVTVLCKGGRGMKLNLTSR